MMMGMHTKQMMSNEDGSVVFVAIVILILLTVMGISATNTSTIEVLIAGNEIDYKEAFYFADGSTDVGLELLEQNLACPEGFTSDNLMIGSANVIDSDFWLQATPPASPFCCEHIGNDDNDTTNAGSRDIRIPNDDSQPHSNLLFYGNTVLSTGSSIMMASGYEGKGKGAGGGGAYILYNVFTRHYGNKGSKVLLMALWRHAIGMEGSCNY